jgi:hypothetical protein
MQSLIDTFGYGYNRKLCEHITCWFLKQYLPKHQIQVTVVHRGLKREGVLGYCDFLQNSHRPRKFLIEIQSNLQQTEYIKTLLHELVHLKQWVTGSLQIRCGKLCYRNLPVNESNSHETEAYEQEEILYQKYLSEKI